MPEGLKDPRARREFRRRLSLLAAKEQGSSGRQTTNPLEALGSFRRAGKITGKRAASWSVSDPFIFSRTVGAVRHKSKRPGRDKQPRRTNSLKQSQYVFLQKPSIHPRLIDPNKLFAVGEASHRPHINVKA